MPRPPATPQARLLGALLDLIYPPRCGGCDRLGPWLCPACLDTMLPPPVPGWACVTCGQALLQEGERLYCPARCDGGGLTAVLPAGTFGGPLREAIHRLKYKYWRVLTPSLVALLEATCAATPSPWPHGVRPYLVPVPLHRRRERERGFNQ